MNKKATFSKVVVLVISMTFIVSAFGTIQVGDMITSTMEMDTGDTANIRDPTGTRGVSPRCVLAELYTNTGCGPCAPANRAINDLLDGYDNTQLVMISTHVDWPDSNDIFYTYNSIEAESRISYYGVTLAPSMFFDGPPRVATNDYANYKSIIDSELGNLADMTISLDGYMSPTSAIVNVTVEITDTPPPPSNVNIKFAIVEDNCYEAGLNGEVRHRYVMKDMLTEEPLPALKFGETHSTQRAWTIDYMLNIFNIAVVVYVQNESDKDVLQAAIFDFIPQEILVVDDDQSTHPDGYEDNYHELLCEMWMSFDGWAYDERGPLTSLDLAPYDVVIWLTGTSATDTLNLVDQLALSAYLDNGKGDLLLCGENIGLEIGASDFYRDYLYSTFVTDDTNDNYMTGIQGDHISDQFEGELLQVMNSSPSEIAPTSYGSSVFEYTSSGGTAAVKAVHDSNSKVVYMACLHFETTDPNRMMVLGNILGWFYFPAYPIDLSIGWNLISLPLEQFDPTIDSVLQSINGRYDSLRWYDITDSQDPWKHNNKYKPSELNDLDLLDHLISFYIHISDPGGARLVVEGMEFWTNQQIDLYPGWNMVGYPSLNDYDRTTGLNNINYGTDVDAIWTYDASTGQWTNLQPSDNFERGGGYLIHSLVTKTWDVPL